MRQNATTPHQGQQYVFGSKPLGAYSLGSAGKPSASEQDTIIDELAEQYGTRLETMDKYSKHVMRASLSLYLCWLYKLTEQSASVPETLIEEAIDHADPDCWSGDVGIDQHICAMVEDRSFRSIATLHPQRIESLLEALSAQLRLDRVLSQENQHGRQQTPF
jgi:hypothetical protein